MSSPQVHPPVLTPGLYFPWLLFLPFPESPGPSIPHLASTASLSGCLSDLFQSRGASWVYRVALTLPRTGLSSQMGGPHLHSSPSSSLSSLPLYSSSSVPGAIFYPGQLSQTHCMLPPLPSLSYHGSISLHFLATIHLYTTQRVAGLAFPYFPIHSPHGHTRTDWIIPSFFLRTFTAFAVLSSDA